MKVLKASLSYISNLSPYVLALILSGILQFSCAKSERDLDTETLSSREHGLALQLFDGLFREIHRFSVADSITNTSGFSFNNNNCIASARFNKTIAQFPVVLTIVYDNNECDDGVARKGQLIAEYTGKYLAKGTVTSVRLKDYVVGSYSVEGDFTIENIGLSSGKPQFIWRVKNAQITGFNTDISWKSLHTLSWTDGSNSSGNATDDIFYILEGQASGRNSRGNAFDATITSRLVSDFDCKWYPEGRLRMQVANLIDRNVSYGEGECDNGITVRRNNTYFEVKLDY